MQGQHAVVSSFLTMRLAWMMPHCNHPSRQALGSTHESGQRSSHNRI